MMFLLMWSKMTTRKIPALTLRRAVKYSLVIGRRGFASLPIFIMTNPKLYKAPNGAQIAYQNIPESGILNVDIFIKSGWRNEGQNEKEYTHLLEHLLMSGSKKYPTEQSMAEVLENIGAKLNAHTSIEYLCLRGEVLKENGRQLIDLMFDKISNPIINRKKIDKEIRVLQEEYHSQINNKNKWLEKHLINQVFPDGSLITPPYPSPYPLDKVTVNAITNYYNKIISPSSIKITVVGEIEESKILEDIKKLVNELGKGRGANLTTIIKKPRSNKPNVLDLTQNNNPDNSIGNLRFSFVTVAAGDKLSPALELISSYLGNGYQAKLFQELRLKNNLTYSYLSKNIKFSDTGIYYFGLTTRYLSEAEKIIKEHFDFWLNQIDETKLIKLKQKLINQAKYNFYSSQKNISFGYGYDLILIDQIQALDNYIEKINKVTIKDIQSVNDLLDIKKVFVLKA